MKAVAAMPEGASSPSQARIVTERRKRVTPGFSMSRWKTVMLSGDPGFAEFLVGLWLIGLRGLILIEIGFTYKAVTEMMAEVHITSGHVGLLLVVCGIAQAVAPASGYFRLRSALAFFGAIICLAGWLAYLGNDLEQTAIAWTWAGLAICEVSLSWRILLSRFVTLSQLTGSR